MTRTPTRLRCASRGAGVALDAVEVSLLLDSGWVERQYVVFSSAHVLVGAVVLRAIRRMIMEGGGAEGEGEGRGR